MDAEEASFMTAQELMTAHIVSMTLKAAMELGLIDALAAAPAGAPLTAAELVAQLPRPAANKAEATAAVDRMLRFLASHGVVTCFTEDDEVAAPDGITPAVLRRYAKAPVCRWLSTNGGEGSLAALAMFGFQQPFLNPWQHMAEAVLSGGLAFEMANGMPAFEYMRQNPQLSALYNQAMSQLSSLACRKMLERFTGGFDDIHVLVDVGGGAGTTLGMITSRYTHIKGINFDLPFVISQAKPIPGVEHVGGNMLDYVPTVDAIFMTSVLHLLDDDDCVKLLKNCHRSVPAEKGKVIAMEVVLPATVQTTQAERFPFQFDMICLLHGLKGGRERTEQEYIYARLATDAGFCGPIRSTAVFGGYRVLEFIKYSVVRTSELKSHQSEFGLKKSDDLNN